MSLSVSRFVVKTYRSVRKRVLPHEKFRLAKQRMPDVSNGDIDIMLRVKKKTMVDFERLHAYMEATRYVVNYGIPGAIVECGVWRGGASMASMLALSEMNVTDRDYYLYDTFHGMPSPTDDDRSIHGLLAREKFERCRDDGGGSTWCRAEIEEVKAAIYSTGYPLSRIHFVKGKVEDTIPATMPEKIAILRLDTDWYESTKHELEHLYPRLSQKGVLLLDDYGHWEGVRKAVDEYFGSKSDPVLFTRNDYSGRTSIKS